MPEARNKMFKKILFLTLLQTLLLTAVFLSLFYRHLKETWAEDFRRNRWLLEDFANKRELPDAVKIKVLQRYHERCPITYESGWRFVFGDVLREILSETVAGK